PAQARAALWVYFPGPLLGMLMAADVYLWLARGQEVACAKLSPHGAKRCIFRCGYADREGTVPPRAGSRAASSAVAAGLGLLALLLTAAPVVLAQQPAAVREAPGARGGAVAAIGLTVSDVERSVAFYRDLLGFDKAADVEVSGPAYGQAAGLSGLRARVVTMSLGAERIELTEYLTPKGRRAPVDSRSNDAWVQHVAIITSDIEQAYLWLRQHKVQQVSPAPQRLPDWNPKASGITAFYFRDPDGHPLEILEFPPDKGDPRWHGASDRIFLGIDHTA